MVHYPIMYLFYSWMIKNQVYTFTETWIESVSAMALSVILAYLCLKWYDLPVRKALSKKM